MGKSAFRLRAALSSLSALCATGAWAQSNDFRDSFPDIQVNSPLGVNIQGGQYSFTENDLVIGPITLQRRYTSRDAPPGAPLPPDGPAFNLRGRIVFYTEHTPALVLPKIYVFVDGQSLQFLRYVDGTIRRWDVASKGWVLSQSGNDYILRHKSGRIYHFSIDTSIPHGNAHTPRRLTLVENPDGSRLEYSYASDGALQSIYSTLGYRLNFVATPAVNRMTACGFNLSQTYATATSICAGAQQQVSYNYGTAANYSAGRITSVTQVDGSVVNYQYNEHGMLTCPTFPNSTICRVTNEYWPLPSQVGELSAGNSYDQVMRQTTATGEVWNYEYDFTAFAGDAPPLTPADLEAGNRRYTTGVMIDPQGRRTIGYFLVGYPEYIDAPSGRTYYDHSGVRIGLVPQGSWRTTPFVYSFFSLVPTGVQFPGGNQLYFNYDAAGNNRIQQSIPRAGSGDTVIEVVRHFPNATPFEFSSAVNPNICDAVSQVLCDKPTKTIDGRGNETDFTYDPVHGGVLTITAPPVSAPDGTSVRPQTRNAYIQRTAMVRDAGGSYVAAGPPIWLLASTSICRTGAASGNGCAIAGDEMVTTYEYGPTSGPNNLLLRGQVVDAGGAALRTCYTYDVNGNRISETTPEGTSAGVPCP